MTPLPDVSEAIFDLSDQVELFLVSKGVSDFEVVQVDHEPEQFDGVLQPLDATEVSMKPENQRTWRLWHLWTDKDMPLDSIFMDTSGAKYRILSKQNWGSYFEYDAKENPTT